MQQKVSWEKLLLQLYPCPYYHVNDTRSVVHNKIIFLKVTFSSKFIVGEILQDMGIILGIF